MQIELLRITIVSMAAGVVLINQGLAVDSLNTSSAFNYVGKGLGGSSDQITEQGIGDTLNYYIGLSSKNEYVGFENSAVDPDSEDTAFGDNNDDQALIIINNNTLVGSSGFLDAGIGKKDIITYEIKQGDTPSSIAESFNISTNTLLWANNLDLNTATKIKPGDKLVILPISGVRHVVKKNDSIANLAKQYSADPAKILSFNNLDESAKLEADSVLIIPGGRIPAPPPAPKPKKVKATLAYVDSNANTKGAKGVYRYVTTEEFDNPNTTAGDSHPPAHGRRFVWGQCTYYVALRRYVPWRGDAKYWLKNAKAFGYKTGSTPTVGSIVVTTENPRYGHVAYVESVGDGKITISEMNFVGEGIKSVRVLSTSSPVIRGYIYDAN